MTKLCIFCQKQVGSKEHIWPEWLRNTIKELPGNNMQMQAKRLNQGNVQFWNQFDPEIKVKSVCVGCNNNWMSDLEKQAKPILNGMINGDPKTLTVEQQKIIVAWVLKCAILFDSQDGNKHYGDDERADFSKCRDPFDRTTVWLGHYSGHQWNAYSQHAVVRNQMRSPPYHVNILTMAFGQLVIQLCDIKTDSPKLTFCNST
jgi:hypothetical protein